VFQGKKFSVVPRGDIKTFVEPVVYASDAPRKGHENVIGTNNAEAENRFLTKNVGGYKNERFCQKDFVAFVACFPRGRERD
jgi:hypothetical protein